MTGLQAARPAFGRFERIDVGDRRVLLLLVKNPAGANEVVRTLVAAGAPRVLVLALNDAIADGRDVSWIWDVDFEPLFAGVERLVLTGDRAAELALRCTYGGLAESAIEVVPGLEAGLDRGLELVPAGGELTVLPTYTAMLALRRILAGARARAAVLGAGSVRIRVGHLYPDYLNIYADRGNIAVLARRAALRGLELEVAAIGLGETPAPGDHDLLYIGGGQDREQALIAPDIAAKGPALAEAVAGGAAVLAVCGGYQLLGRFYRDRYGSELPGAGVLPLHTVAGDRRMIGDVLLECSFDPAGTRTLAGFENHAGRTILDEGAEPLGRVIAGFGNDGTSGFEGCRAGRVVGTYLHGPLLPRNPWLADWLLAQAAAHRSGGEPPEFRAARRPARGRGARGLGRPGALPAAGASSRALARLRARRRDAESPAGTRRSGAASSSARTAPRTARSRGSGTGGRAA